MFVLAYLRLSAFICGQRFLLLVLIRRFGREPITARQMIENQSITEAMLELLSAMVKGRLNILPPISSP